MYTSKRNPITDVQLYYYEPGESPVVITPEPIHDIARKSTGNYSWADWDRASNILVEEVEITEENPQGWRFVMYACDTSWLYQVRYYYLTWDCYTWTRHDFWVGSLGGDLKLHKYYSEDGEEWTEAEDSPQSVWEEGDPVPTPQVEATYSDSNPRCLPVPPIITDNIFNFVEP